MPTLSSKNMPTTSFASSTSTGRRAGSALRRSYLLTGGAVDDVVIGEKSMIWRALIISSS
jgi:hypothetical protein